MIKIRPDPFNLVICGVGGQGNILVSQLVGNVLLKKGFNVTVADDIGVSQRTGSVSSRIRFSKGAYCGPLIADGQAHFVLGLEPLETLRMLSRYGNPHVLVLTNMTSILPASTFYGQNQYPAVKELRAAIRLLSRKSWFIHATRIAINLGLKITANVVMLGAMTATAAFPFTLPDIEKELKLSVPAKMLEMNLTALRSGHAALISSRKPLDQARSERG